MASVSKLKTWFGDLNQSQRTVLLLTNLLTLVATLPQITASLGVDYTSDPLYPALVPVLLVVVAVYAVLTLWAIATIAKAISVRASESLKADSASWVALMVSSIAATMFSLYHLGFGIGSAMPSVVQTVSWASTFSLGAVALVCSIGLVESLGCKNN